MTPAELGSRAWLQSELENHTAERISKWMADRKVNEQEAIALAIMYENSSRYHEADAKALRKIIEELDNRIEELEADVDDLNRHPL